MGDLGIIFYKNFSNKQTSVMQNPNKQYTVIDGLCPTDETLRGFSSLPGRRKKRDSDDGVTLKTTFRSHIDEEVISESMF